MLSTKTLHQVPLSALVKSALAAVVRILGASRTADAAMLDSASTELTCRRSGRPPRRRDYTLADAEYSTMVAVTITLDRKTAPLDSARRARLQGASGRGVGEDAGQRGPRRGRRRQRHVLSCPVLSVGTELRSNDGGLRMKAYPCFAPHAEVRRHVPAGRLWPSNHDKELLNAAVCQARRG